MGYILPVRHYNRERHHYRKSHGESQPELIEKTYRVIFDEVNANMENNPNKKNELVNKELSKKIKKQQTNAASPTAVQNKGEHVNIQV